MLDYRLVTWTLAALVTVLIFFSLWDGYDIRNLTNRIQALEASTTY